jgi:hypothetical protein
VQSQSISKATVVWLYNSIIVEETPVIVTVIVTFAAFMLEIPVRPRWHVLKSRFECTDGRYPTCVNIGTADLQVHIVPQLVTRRVGLVGFASIKDTDVRVVIKVTDVIVVLAKVRVHIASQLATCITEL